VRPSRSISSQFFCGWPVPLIEQSISTDIVWSAARLQGRSVGRELAAVSAVVDAKVNRILYTSVQKPEPG
jgi:hypothetical protein